MATIINTKVGECRGRKRVWMQGRQIEREGFEPGMKYDLEKNGSKISLHIKPDGKYVVSKRNRSGNVIPIIDLTTNEVAELFDGVEMVRVLIKEGSITITAHHQQINVEEREDRILSKLKHGEKLAVGSLFHGGGILDKSIHHGFKRSGIASAVRIAVELESVYLDSSLRNNPELWDDQSIPIETPIQSLNMAGKIPKLDVVVGGIPCTGASRSGRSKNKLKFAESHSAAGAMFFSFLQFVQMTNPAIVLIENVPEYQNTASMEVIRSVLASLGYNLQERVLDGNEFGVLEKRKRMCAVALSNGLEADFCLDAVQPLRTKEAMINEILEPVPLDSDRWKSFDYLAEKEARDKAAGKGFARQLLTGEEGHLGTVAKDYAKCRSTEPFIVHPEQSNLSRLLTPLEHCRVKGIPEGVIAGNSDSVSHQILGQSVIFPLFEAVAMHLGASLRNCVGETQPIQQLAA